ncbi:transposase [Peptoniphilus indolicus]|uniref:ISChy4 n=2 Tax=Peptoniphilus indolicus TaxID=33030 RepID=G4D786_9FIRM|nr:ATP-binding protein [Peptoniphilus indolicus]EGY76236.1 ISChy4 [Peptoniphilus indolicus ATCC 29427]SUB76230.1 transposase [Peptoniphilus indolicus]
MGYLPLNDGDERLIFQLIDKRYEKKSTIITTNLNFNEWSKLFYDEKVAAAIIDRLLHHATVYLLLEIHTDLKSI